MGFTRLTPSKPDDRGDLGVLPGRRPRVGPVVRSAHRHGGIRARLPRAPLGRPADRRRNSTAAAHRRPRPRARHDPHRTPGGQRGGAGHGPTHRGSRRRRPRDACARARGGARAVSPAHDARRPARGDRGARACRSRTGLRSRPGRGPRCSRTARAAPRASPPARGAAEPAREPRRERPGGPDGDAAHHGPGRVTSRGAFGAFHIGSPEDGLLRYRSDRLHRAPPGRAAARKAPGQDLRAGARELAGRLDELLERWTMVVGPSAAERVEPVLGDLRRPLLGVEKEQVAELRGKVTHFFHLAAVYDMTAPRRAQHRRQRGRNHPRGRTRSRASTPSTCTTSPRSPSPGTYRGVFDRGHVRRGPAAALALPPHEVRVRADRPRAALRPVAGVPAGDRGRRLADRRDGQDRWPVLLLQGDRAHAPPAAGVGAAGRPRPRQHEHRAGRLGGRRARAHRARARPRRRAPSTSPTRAPSAWTTCSTSSPRAAHAPRFALQRRQTAARPAAEVAAGAGAALPPLRQVRKLALRELGIPEEVLGHMELVPRFDTREAARALAGSPLDSRRRCSDYVPRLWDYWEREMDTDLAAAAPSRRRSRASTC